MGRRKKIVQECERLMDNPENIRNIAIAAHVDHGKTTLTDNLLAGAGMISENTAGQQLAMDTEEDEQERGITIDAANVSMTHEYEGTNHLINLIDTPGHVDFGGDVTRAMRAVDGAMVVVDAVEGAMPQTETVVRQALREGVKPTLFINKVDRLISELQEGPQEMQERLMSVIADVNELIRGMTEDMDDIDDWTVSVEEGTVAFGSALYKWGVSMPSMQATGIDFGDIIELERNGERQELHERTPLSNVVLDMVCEHFPNPVDAQPRRIPRIWRGDAESELAETMRFVDDEGEVVFMVTDISMDPHAGEIATGRVFSGTLEKGQELYVSGTAGKNRLQSVGLFMGGEREEVGHVPAGNIAAVTGLRDAIAGSTVSSVEMTPFESIEHISEPVITKSVEAKSMDDLPKLIQTLRQVSKEDPTIQVTINEDTGEHLISGQGELHLEVITQRIERNQGIPVNTGEPIVVYREAVRGATETVEDLPEPPQPVLPHRRAAFGGHRRPDPARRGLDGHARTGAPRGAPGVGHGQGHLPERRAHLRHQRLHRRHEGDPAPQRDDGARHRGARGGARRGAARRRARPGHADPTERRPSSRGHYPPRSRTGDPRGSSGRPPRADPRARLADGADPGRPHRRAQRAHGRRERRDPGPTRSRRRHVPGG